MPRMILNATRLINDIVEDERQLPLLIERWRRNRGLPTPTNKPSKSQASPLRRYEPRVDIDERYLLVPTQRRKARLFDSSRGHAYRLHTDSDD